MKTSLATLRRRLLLILIVLSLLCAKGATARSLRFHVGRERRLAEVARKVYGRSNAAIILATANRLPPGAEIKEGDSLRVPVCLHTTSKRGQSLTRLARLHLRRKSRAVVLAAVNRLDPDKPVAAGTTVIVPALLWHEARRGDSMISLSRAYYRNRDGRWLLRKVNGNRPSNKLEVGEKILVPIFAGFALEQKVQQRIDALTSSVSKPKTTTSAQASGSNEAGTEKAAATPASTTLKSKKSDDSTSAEPPTVDMTQAYQRALRSPLIEQGLAFYRRGDFLACVAYFRRALLDPGLAPGRRVAAQIWLSSCYVGADETERAEEAMLGALRAAPRLQLDRASTSPKILQVYERAHGRMASN